MGKGGKGEAAAGEGENMAAWLVAKNTLKILPYKLPPLGSFLLLPVADFRCTNRLALFYKNVLYLFRNRGSRIL